MFKSIMYSTNSEVYSIFRNKAPNVANNKLVAFASLHSHFLYKISLTTLGWKKFSVLRGTEHFNDNGTIDSENAQPITNIIFLS